MVDLIRKKRDGEELSREEIDFIIQGYTQETIPDYQMSAWSMAVFFRGMTDRETAWLTDAMVRSGERADLSAIRGIKVDKHSTGGVGDTTTLVLAPLVAAAGVPVAKMSGRGLGHTGGTIDKLESIPGFRVELSKDEFIRNVNRDRVAVVGQTANLTPADKKLYALRDVTATVDSIPLIASSIMSKKIAAGADAIVLDVKTGSGAFMKSLSEAKQLAKAMVEIGNALRRKTVAVISNMDQPLGMAIGNALEVREAIETLKGDGPEDLTELCLTLGAHMLVLAQQAPDVEDGYRRLQRLIESGDALEAMKRFIRAQGGDSDVVDHPETLAQAARKREVKAPRTGTIQSMHAERIGTVAMELGAGRETKESEIDLFAGIELKKKVGDPVKEGEPLAVLHTNKKDTEALEKRFLQAVRIASEPVAKLPLIYDVIDYSKS